MALVVGDLVYMHVRLCLIGFAIQARDVVLFYAFVVYADPFSYELPWTPDMFL